VPSATSEKCPTWTGGERDPTRSFFVGEVGKIVEVKVMETPEKLLQRVGIQGLAAAILMIIFGALIIAFPALISWLVGIYLIVVGALNLAGEMEKRGAAKAESPESGATQAEK